MQMSKKAYLWLPLALIPPVASLWTGRYLVATMYCLFLLWLFHPSGAPDWRAQLRSTRKGMPTFTTFSKVVFGIGGALSLWIVFTRT